MGDHPHSGAGAAPNSGLDQPSPDRVARQLHAIGEPELLQDVRAMALDGLLGQHELVRDLAAAVSLGDQLDDLELARAERIDGLPLPATGPGQVVTHQRANRARVYER